MTHFLNAHHLAAVAAAEAADKAVGLVALGELSSMGQIESYIKDAMAGFFAKYGPWMAQQFQTVAEPAAKKAAEIIGPVVEQKLKDYAPTFGLIVGGVLGAAYLIGLFSARREGRGAR